MRRAACAAGLGHGPCTDGLTPAAQGMSARPPSATAACVPKAPLRKCAGEMSASSTATMERRRTWRRLAVPCMVTTIRHGPPASTAADDRVITAPNPPPIVISPSGPSQPSSRLRTALSRPVRPIDLRAGRRRVGGSGRRCRRVVGDDSAEFGARADAMRGEHLVEVVLDRPRADEQLGSDLRVGETVDGRDPLAWTCGSAWQRSSPPSRFGRSLETSSERAVRARSDDRNRGRKRAHSGGHGRTSLDRPERGRANPSPHRDAHPGMRALREDDGAADAAPPRNRGFLDIGARRRRPGRPQPAAGAPSSRRDDLIALPSTWVVARIAGRTQ
jgi:hypothetical protein